MNRRELLSGMGAVGAAAIAARAALAQQDPNKQPAKQPATGTTGHEHHHTAGGSKHQGLIDSAHACMATGDACINHCLQSLGTGDKSLGECAKSVEAMLPMVTATAKLAAQDGKRLKELAAVCGKACRDCEAECKKHEQHPECKACGEACNKCAAECDKV
jgi:Cys-rich four helix bundle protein (predicted Tat secretion target)